MKTKVSISEPFNASFLQNILKQEGRTVGDKLILHSQLIQDSLILEFEVVELEARPRICRNVTLPTHPPIFQISQAHGLVTILENQIIIMIDVKAKG